MSTIFFTNEIHMEGERRNTFWHRSRLPWLRESDGSTELFDLFSHRTRWGVEMERRLRHNKNDSYIGWTKQPFPVHRVVWKGATYLTCSFDIKEYVKRALLLLFPISCFRTAVCRQQCLNGGMCTRPNVCACPNAFEGPTCELDVDECATGAHGCLGPSSRCVNMAGWYYCACSPGYQNVIMYPIATAFGEPANALEAIRRSPQLGTMCQGKNKHH